MEQEFKNLRKGQSAVLEHRRDGITRYSLEPISRVTKTLIRLTNGMRFRKSDGTITESSRKKHTTYRLLFPTEENKEKVYQNAQKIRKVIYLQKLNWHRFEAHEIFEIYDLITTIKNRNEQH